VALVRDCDYDECGVTPFEALIFFFFNIKSEYFCEPRA
jgi:hypothetical protein